jgi:thymidylate kinase
MGADFFRSIARGYDKCEKWKPLKDRFIRIDGNGTQEEVFARILEKLEIK